jgi:hypothetical protein
MKLIWLLMNLVSQEWAENQMTDLINMKTSMILVLMEFQNLFQGLRFKNL